MILHARRAMLNEQCSGDCEVMFVNYFQRDENYRSHDSHTIINSDNNSSFIHSFIYFVSDQWSVVGLHTTQVR